MQHGACCGIRRTKTRHGSEKPCWSRSLEGLGTTGRLGLEGLLLTHVSQLIVQWIDFRLEGGGEVFRRVLRFPLRKHVLVFSVFASLFPTLLYSIILLCCLVYGLEQLLGLYACVYTIPHFVLKLCKIYRAVILIGGSKQLLCFQHVFELSYLIQNTQQKQ